MIKIAFAILLLIVGEYIYYKQSVIFIVPQMIMCFICIYHHLGDVGVSIVIGSVLFQTLITFGIGSMLNRIALKEEIIQKKLSLQIVAGILLIYLAGDYLLHGKYANKIISRTDGIILIVIYGCYLGHEIWLNHKLKLNENKENIEKSQEDDQILQDKIKKEQDRKRIAFIKKIWICLCSIILMSVGGEILVQNIFDSENLFWDRHLIGMVIFALGINLVPFFRIIQKKKEVGNIIDMNIAGSLLLIGLIAMVNPVSISMDMMVDFIYLPIIGSVVWLLAFRNLEWTRVHGCIMVTMYIFYMFIRVM